MSQEMLVISKEQINALIGRLGESGKLDSCIEEVKRMLDIKSALCWRADAGGCCAGRGLAVQLEDEVKILEKALNALEAGNVSEGISLLSAYEKIIHLGY